MNQNPYDPPTTVDATPTARRSRRPYFIASSVVLVEFVALAAFVCWYTDANIDGGEIWFHIPAESVSNSPSGDPFIAYDRMFYTTIGGVAVLCAILLALTLAVVNGLILFWRR